MAIQPNIKSSVIRPLCNSFWDLVMEIIFWFLFLKIISSPGSQKGLASCYLAILNSNLLLSCLSDWFMITFEPNYQLFTDEAGVPVDLGRDPTPEIVTLVTPGVVPERGVHPSVVGGDHQAI